MNKSDIFSKVGCFLFIFIVVSAILYMVFTTIYKNEYNNIYSYKEKQLNYTYDSDFDFIFDENSAFFDKLNLLSVKNIQMRVATNDDFKFKYSFEIILENTKIPISIDSQLTNILDRPFVQYQIPYKKIYYPFSHYDLNIDVSSRKVYIDNVDVHLLDYFYNHSNNYKLYLSNNFNNIIKYIHREITYKTIIGFQKNNLLTEYINNNFLEKLNKIQKENISVLAFKYLKTKEPLALYTEKIYQYLYLEENTLIKSDEFNIADLGKIQSLDNKSFSSMYLIYNGSNWVVYIDNKYINTHRKFYEEIINKGIHSASSDIEFKKAIKQSWNLKI